jgi:hypothetical protein
MLVRTKKVTSYDGGDLKTIEYVFNSNAVEDMFAAGQGTMLSVNNVLVHILVDFEKLCDMLNVKDV